MSKNIKNSELPHHRKKPAVMVAGPLHVGLQHEPERMLTAQLKQVDTMTTGWDIHRRELLLDVEHCYAVELIDLKELVSLTAAFSLDA